MKYIISGLDSRSNIFFRGFFFARNVSKDPQFPVLVEACAVAGVPDSEDTAGSVVVQPPVLGPEEQVAFLAQTGGDLQFNVNCEYFVKQELFLPERSRC